MNKSNCCPLHSRRQSTYNVRPILNGYISSIETGKSKPSVEMLIYICEELDVSMSDFFDEEQQYPVLIEQIVKEAKKLDKSSLESVLNVMKNMNK